MQDRQSSSKSLWYSAALAKRKDTLPSCYFCSSNKGKETLVSISSRIRMKPNTEESTLEGKESLVEI